MHYKHNFNSSLWNTMHNYDTRINNHFDVEFFNSNMRFHNISHKGLIEFNKITIAMRYRVIKYYSKESSNPIWTYNIKRTTDMYCSMNKISGMPSYSIIQFSHAVIINYVCINFMKIIYKYEIEFYILNLIYNYIFINLKLPQPH